jgi:hypothetical protein
MIACMYYQLPQTVPPLQTIFGELWEEKGHKLRRRVKKAFGIEKKLQEKQGQLLYKGMVGWVPCAALYSCVVVPPA